VDVPLALVFALGNFGEGSNAPEPDVLDPAPALGNDQAPKPGSRERFFIGPSPPF
jgi:hypothetical protein